MIELSPSVLSIAMFILLFIGIFTGHPLAFVLGGIAVVFGALGWGVDIFSIFANRIFGLMDDYVLVAVPLFVLMANLLDQSGIVEKLFDVMRYLFGPIKGGIAIAIVVVSTIFGACTGIVGASVVTMGLIGLPVLLKYKYDTNMSCGLICAGGTLGILIPPSLMLIVMGNQANLSVGKLFAGALIPGLILSILYIIYIAVRCQMRPQDGPAITHEERKSINTKELFMMSLKSLIPPVILILGVLGSIFAGIASPTEAAGVGAFLALLLALLYRKLTRKGMISAVISTGKTTTMVMVILVGATCFTGVFLGIGGGDVVNSSILALDLGKWGSFFVMMFICFILGMFLDWIGIIMITFPLFIPLSEQLGFDKLWFVVAIAVMLQNSFLTPPFGYALFYLKGVAPEKIAMSNIMLGSLPYVVLMLVAFSMVCIWPETITWFPATFVK